MKPLTVVKIGGEILSGKDGLSSLVDRFVRLGGARILVHGGGAQANLLLRSLGIHSVQQDGRRVTDADTLDVVTMVYAGLNSKRLVAELQARGVDAIGLSGADANLLKAERRPVAEIDYGYVGDVETAGVNVARLSEFMEMDMVPVLNAITHDGCGTLLNTNADTIASTVARAMTQHFEVDLTFVIDRPGVLEDPEDPRTVIRSLAAAQIERVRSTGAVLGGMLPKLENASRALAGGVATVRICGVDGLDDPRRGTLVVEEMDS